MSSLDFALCAPAVQSDRQQVLQPTRTDPGQVVATLTRMLARVLGPAIELRTTLDPAAGQVVLDPALLEEVVLNLVLYARDAMPNGGCLEIETTSRTLAEPLPHAHGVVASGDYLVIAVRDGGTGMSEVAVSRIFYPFLATQKDGDVTRTGLSTVYGIVKQAGGHVIVNSVVGAGTTFDLYLLRLPSSSGTG